MVIFISLNFNNVVSILTTQSGLNISKKLIINNISVFIFILISLTSYMTSITNSTISLEGKNLNILKSLPIRYKTLLITKVLAYLVITTPILVIGNIILFIKFRFSILEFILLLILSLLIPLVSHFLGLIINLKYPKLDATNPSEVVKQSSSSLFAVTFGMLLIIITIAIIKSIIGQYSALFILSGTTLFYIIINILLYFYLVTIGVRNFKKITI